MKSWNKLLTNIRKLYGRVSYIWVKERQKNGTLHLHFVVDAFIDYDTLKDLWVKYTRAHQVKFKKREDLTPEQAKNYMTKYICKNAISKVKACNRRARLWGRSLGMKTLAEMELMWYTLSKKVFNVASEWELMDVPVGDIPDSVSTYEDSLYVFTPVYERVCDGDRLAKA